MSTSQRNPEYPALHRQEKLSRPSWQVPPLKQALSGQSLGLLLHVLPTYPTGHEQKKSSTRSVHDPPFSHGLEAQLSTFIAQLSPTKPFKQLQE